MSHYPPSTTSKYAWDRNPKPHAPLAVTVPPPDFPVESSHFSPESTHRISAPSQPPITYHTRSHSAWTNTATIKSMTRDPELGKATPPQSPKLRDRFTKFFFDIRVPTQKRESEWVPMHDPPLQSWPPLEIEKRKFCHHCQKHDDRRRRRRVLLIALIIVLLFLLGDTIFLNVRVGQLSSQTSSTTSTSSSGGLSEDAQQCLSQFSLNAPNDPESYPCSTCLSTLQSVPSSFTSSNSNDSQQILNALQFCGLRSIFDSASGEGQTGLSNGGWAKDVRFCAWSGVRCDGFGRVASIQLTFPAVPQTIPEELSALEGLTSLAITGDGSIPAGDVPTSFKSVSTLATVNLQSTAVNTIPSNTLSNVSTLTLVKNAMMTGDMTSLFSSLPLTNLVINSQTLPTNPITALLSSSAARTLQTLDLSSTSLSGSLPSDLSGFTSMIELHLDNNTLSNPLPSKFPSSLQALTLTGNSQLSGTASFCGLSSLQTCDARGTSLSAAQSGCGSCLFGSSTSSTSTAT